MNVAMVSEHASPLATLGGVDAGGQNVHVAELGAALVRAGHDVTVYTRRDDANLPDSVTMDCGVRVAHVLAGPARTLAKDAIFRYMDDFAVGLQRELRRSQPDLVHSHFWMSAYAALEAVKPLGIPVVHTFHALGSEKRRHQGAMDTSPEHRLRHERRIATTVDRIVATSSAEIFALSQMGAPAQRLSLVPCGVNVAAFDALPGRRDLPRRRPFRIVALSRLVERKGLADVLLALRRLPEAELVIGGGGDAQNLHDDPEAERLGCIAAQAGLSDRVTFLGPVSRQDVPPLLRSADVVVCAPWYEPFGIVPLEAMACGVPVVATAVGGLNDTILDDVTGYHVPPHAPDALARAIDRLIASPSLRRRLGAAGRQRVIARYTWERVARDSVRAYQTVSFGAPSLAARGSA